MSERVRVVVGMLKNAQGRIFLQQRPPGKEFEWCWEMLGGKVQELETDAEALVREFREELCLFLSHNDLEDKEPFSFQQFDPPLVRLPCDIVIYEVSLALPGELGAAFPQDPILKEGQPGMGWFTMKEIQALNVPVSMNFLLGRK